MRNTREPKVKQPQKTASNSEMNSSVGWRGRKKQCKFHNFRNASSMKEVTQTVYKKKEYLALF